MTHSLRMIRFGALALVSVMALGIATVAIAADPTPTPNSSVTHPAHVHKGTCAQLDPNPQYPLNDVGQRTNSDGNAPKSSDLKGSLTAAPVEVAKEKKIDAKLDDLLGAAHAINVHESTANIQTYIACGDIGGYVLDDTLIIGLKQQNNSGYSGIAILQKDGDQTKVTIYLARDLSGTVKPNTTPVPPGTPAM